MGTSRNVERRTILKAAGATAATLGLAATTGCGGDSGSGNGTVTIRYAWWGAEERTKRINQSIALFEKKYPKIKVQGDFQDYVAFWEKFQTQAAGGNPPDVFQNAVGFLRKYDKRGILLDLKSQVDAGHLRLDDFREGVTKVGEVDGKQLGVPVGSNTMALVIDKKAFQKAGVTATPGWTWDDYFKALKTIYDKTKVPGDTGYFSIMYLYDLYLRQNGKAFFTKDGLGFDKADLTEWWQDGYNRTKAGVVTDPKTVAQDRPKSSLSAGHAASEFTWDNFTVRYTAEGDSEYGLAPIPTMDGKNTGQYLASLMLSASARTAHPKEVAQFIDFMVHDPEVGRIMGYDRGILASTEQYAAFKPTDAVAKEIAQYEADTAKAGVLGTITPHPSGADTIEAAFLRIAGDMSLGKTKVSDAVKQFFDESEAAFQA
ncbi:carbohydrate ABC transporter substrate-binding protein, CUT1 family (TC 3.A.1.1.-) [Streptomyces sp. yr375]|uniref:ABC transporter substrate-binding protein n=1 Tax=Streptomyces sp. yr375 TaxID=1761906 RepID=UPI0008AE3DF9|nr:sugar ABC transporter substrate-binding protein [Streptomyces sp. yr375]SER16093.1 carbohydrate ABC transporter substrate-binding protein, CUT1 family (TC 3.A.1.1.-) [Streptomyces sp. yr375]